MPVKTPAELAALRALQAQQQGSVMGGGGILPPGITMVPGQAPQIPMQMPGLMKAPASIEEAALQYSLGGGPMTAYDPRQGISRPPQDELSAFGQSYAPTRGSYSPAPVIQQSDEDKKAATEASRNYDLNARGPEYVAQQEAAIARAEMEKAKAGAYENAYEAGSIPELNTGALIKIEVPDGKGGTLQRFITRQEAMGGSGSGQGFAKPAGKIPAQIASRVEAAHAAMASAAMIKAELQKPEVRAALGPVAGRITNIQELIGNPPPELQKLSGALEGYFFNTMGVHGMRSAEAAHRLKEDFGHNFTPEAMEARLEGLNEIPSYFASLAPATRSDLVGDQPTGATPAANAAPVAPKPLDLQAKRKQYNY